MPSRYPSASRTSTAVVDNAAFLTTSTPSISGVVAPETTASNMACSAGDGVWWTINNLDTSSKITLVTRASYDTVAASYAEFIPDAHDGRPLDAAIMRAFAELAEDPVADLGCGTGRITQHLHELGVDAFGVDLSEGMLEQARSLYPHLGFTQGDITKLEMEDDSLGGAVVWYSTVHMPAQAVPWNEFHRVLRPGGYLLHAFKAGNQKRHLTHAYGHDVDLYVYWHDVDETAGNAIEAGFNEVARLVRQKGVDEGGPQAFLLVQKRNPATRQTS